MHEPRLLFPPNQRACQLDCQLDHDQDASVRSIFYSGSSPSILDSSDSTNASKFNPRIADTSLTSETDGGERTRGEDQSQSNGPLIAAAGAMGGVGVVGAAVLFFYKSRSVQATMDSNATENAVASPSDLATVVVETQV